MLTVKKNKSNTKSEICSSIGSRQVIRFYYLGGFRCAEPHIYGLLKADTEALLCYQIHGYSVTDVPTGWKLFRASDIAKIEVTGENFRPLRQKYDMDFDSRYSLFQSITCEVITDTIDDYVSTESTSQLPQSESNLPDLSTSEEYIASVGSRKEPVITESTIVSNIMESATYPMDSIVGHYELMRRFRLSHPVPVPNP